MATLDVAAHHGNAAHFAVPDPNYTILIEGAVPVGGGAAVGGWVEAPLLLALTLLVGLSTLLATLPFWLPSQ